MVAGGFAGFASSPMIVFPRENTYTYHLPPVLSNPRGRTSISGSPIATMARRRTHGHPHGQFADPQSRFRSARFRNPTAEAGDYRAAGIGRGPRFRQPGNPDLRLQ